ncbi:signal peptidase I [Demetria terragena]|uniref:signal peptidase I n=1 Tax=Demetria terragena TaxID=63959 RepID=UPI0003732091|nr:signal peptidase I [Demetria terragena]
MTDERPNDQIADTDAVTPADEPAVAPSPPEDAPPRRSGWGRVREYFVVIVIAVGLSFLVKTFLVQPFWIPSGSMENTLVTGDRIVVNKIPGSASDLHRGDIVVFEDPDGWLPPPPETGGVRGVAKSGLQFVGLYPAGEQHLVKRIIGVGGDHVVCCDEKGRLTVNGQPINETYLDAGVKPSLTKFDIRVPKGQLWMMGDNRGNSADSRAHDEDGGGSVGSVPEAKVTGKTLAVVWPFGHIGRPEDASAVFDQVPDP